MYIKFRTLPVFCTTKDILTDLELVYREASLSYISVKEWT